MIDDPRNAKIAELQTTLGLVQGEMINRAMPRIGEMIDAINNVTRGANLGNAPAKDILRQFYAALDAGRDATSRLTVVRNGGAPSPS
jgi:hypothetical protein